MAKRKQQNGFGDMVRGRDPFYLRRGFFFIHIHTCMSNRLTRGTGRLATATVINVNKRSGKQRRTAHAQPPHGFYDIYYQYEADGDLYTDVIYGMNAGKKVR